MNEPATRQTQPVSLVEGTADSAPASGNIPGQVRDSGESEAELLSALEAPALARVGNRTIRIWFAGDKSLGKLDGHKRLVCAGIRMLPGTTPGTLNDFSAKLGQEPDTSSADVFELEASAASRDVMIRKLMNQLVGAASGSVGSNESWNHDRPNCG